MSDVYTVLPFLIIGVGWIWGVHCLFEESYLLGFIPESLKWLPDWITKPLWGCPACMSSVHGSILFLIFLKVHLIWWPVYCVCLCGFNYIISEYVAIQKED